MKRLLYIVLAGFILSSCGVYKKYTPQNQAPDDVFGTKNADFGLQTADSSIAQISWRDFFSDPLLQQLIDTALVRNTDYRSTRLTVEKAQAALTAAKLAYLPSLAINPQGGVSSSIGSSGASSPAWTYNIPLQLDWNIGISGSVTVNKRKAKAVLLQAEAQHQAMQANLIATVAQEYLMLQMLDRQLEILVLTDSLWKASLETQRTLWENGKAYSTAVNQMESSYLSVKTQIVDARREILSVENDLCQLLAITPQHIARNPWGAYSLPERFGTGVPAELLQNRPDIRLADHTLEEAFYNTAAARAAFYPSLSLQGLLGWTNNIGTIINPAQLLLQAAASLLQPVFAQGKLVAGLKIAKLDQEDQLNQYVQTVIEAGNQVNEALADCQVAKDKDILYKKQVAVLQDAYTGTHELMDNGKANYLEVLTAQESLLSAQLNEAANLYYGAEAIIALYIALGGATK